MVKIDCRLYCYEVGKERVLLLGKGDAEDVVLKKLHVYLFLIFLKRPCLFIGFDGDATRLMERNEKLQIIQTILA